jgi:hypothetical protein
MNKKIAFFSSSFALLTIVSCGSSSPDKPQSENGPGARGSGNLKVSGGSARLVQSGDERPPCVDELRGQLIYRLDTETFEVCDASNWLTVDISGERGEAGPSGANGEVGPSGPQGTSGTAGARGENGEAGISASTATVFLFDANDSKIGYPDWTQSPKNSAGAIGVFLDQGFFVELYTGTGYARVNTDVMQICYFENAQCEGDCRVGNPNQMAFALTATGVAQELRTPTKTYMSGFVAASAWTANGCRTSQRTLTSSYGTTRVDAYPFAAPLQFRLQVSTP